MHGRARWPFLPMGIFVQLTPAPQKNGTEELSLMSQLLDKFGDAIETDEKLKNTIKACGSIMYAGAWCHALLPQVCNEVWSSVAGVDTVRISVYALHGIIRLIRAVDRCHNFHFHSPHDQIP